MYLVPKKQLIPNNTKDLNCSALFLPPLSKTENVYFLGLLWRKQILITHPMFQKFGKCMIAPVSRMTDDIAPGQL